MKGEDNSNLEAVKKEMSDQIESYCGLIDEKDNLIGKVHAYVCMCRDVVTVYMYVAVYICTYDLKYCH